MSSRNKIFAALVVAVLCAGCGSSTRSSAGKCVVLAQRFESNAVAMLEGTILEVMESWPLQLLVQTGKTKNFIGLSEHTTVMRGGRSVDPGVLSPGMLVRIRGHSTERVPKAMNADQIYILD